MNNQTNKIGLFVYRLYIQSIGKVYRKYIVRSLFLRPGFAQGILN
jgi:hypothetical protein